MDRTKYDSFEYQPSSNSTSNSNGRAQLFCGPELQATYYDNPSGCNSDRKVTIRAYASYTFAGSFYTPHLVSETYGRRSNSFCIWTYYQTRLTTKNSFITVYMGIVNNGATGFYFCNTFDDYYGTSDEYEHILFNGNLYGEIEKTGGSTPSIDLYRIHEEATSRGVGETNWAIINCTWATIICD